MCYEYPRNKETDCKSVTPNLAANINAARVSFRDLIESCESTFELELLTIEGLRNLVNDIPVGKADGLDPNLPPKNVIYIHCVFSDTCF